MLYHAVSEAGSGVDIEQIVIRLRERLDEALFVRAWNEVLQRHTILRTRFRWVGVPEFRQEVVEHASLPVQRVDWSSLAPAQQEKRFTAQLAADRREDFDLTRAPSMRLFMARLDADDHQVIWTFHHALLDGRSFPVVLREVFEIHAALQRGETATLAEPRPYREYIDWHQSLNLDGAQAYWSKLLHGFHAATPFNVDVADEPAREPGGSTQQRLSRQVTAALRSRASAIGVTVNTLLQGAWALLLHRYSGESDLVFGATRAGRTTGLGDGEGLVGLFINTLPMRVHVDGDQDVVEWLRALREHQLQMRPHEHAPLVKVQSWSTVARGKPLFESLVVYDHDSLDARLRALGGAWETRHFEYIGQTNYPLAVIAYGDAEMLVRIEYSRQRFSDPSIARMLGHLITLLEGLANGAARQLKELSLLTAAERANLLADPDSMCTDPRRPALHELFEQQVERRPDAIALTAFGADETRREFSYAELNRRANRVAHQLRALGVVPNQLVGLRTDRNAELVIGLLAILKAGGAYLPLDPVYPRERIAFMLEDSGAAVVLSQTSLKAGLAGINVRVICLDEPIGAGIAADANPSFAADGNPSPMSGADDLAYVIYTSGSTGKPKGVLITHHNVARLFAATEPWYHFNERDVWTLFHSYAFDFSVWELWGALLYGGRVVAVSIDTSRSTDAFRELLLREQVTVLNQTPTAFRQLIDADAAQPKAAFALRYVIFGGEALELQSLRPWFERHGDQSPQLINMYGITETTVHVTYRPITLADLDAGAGSVIGVPIPDLKIYLLDAHGEPAPIGVPAEIYVAGGGVAQGYLNRPELTAQRFLRDPFQSDPKARIYRTGDLARRLENGDIEYLGRIDQQVKIRGFRIELGEIEAHILKHPQVRQVAVIAREDVAGDKRLVAYLVCPGQDDQHDEHNEHNEHDGQDEQGQPGQIVEQLRLCIRAALPDYMMPAHFVLLPVLPLTQNGKLDRAALPAPVVLRSDSDKPFVAPRNATERTIAAVWQTVLRVERVSVDDHFFELGGDSILSIQVIARCRAQGVQFTPKDLFNRPTIALLAGVVRAAPVATHVSHEPVSGAVPLTPIQVWFFEQQFADPQHWNQAFMFGVPAGLDLQALEVALRGLLSRHDVLRMRYHQDAAGRLLQQYGADDSNLHLGRIDLSGVATDHRTAAIEAAATAEQATLSLQTGPLLRAVHFHLGAKLRGRLLLAVHHLVVDGVSWRVLCEDLETLYRASAGGAVASLPEKTSSFQTWAKALHEHARGVAVQATFSDWQALAAKPVLKLAHHAAGQAPFAAEGKLIRRLSREDTRALLQRLPAVFQTQINDVLLTALARALQRSTANTTLRIDLEGHGREHLVDGVDVSRTVGWFTTLFPIALDIDPGNDMVDTLLTVKDQLQHIPDRGLSYGLLRYLSSDAAVRDGLARLAPSPVLFNYLGQFDAIVADSALFSFASESTGPWRSPRARRTHALEIIAVVRNGQLEMAWHHDAEAQHEASIAQLADDMLAGLLELIGNATSSQRRARAPVDFPLARLDAARLTRLAVRYPQLDDVYPLTPMQRLFFAMENSPANPGFEQWHFRLDGSLDPALLRRAIEAVIERHVMLRTAFVDDGGAEPLQIVSAGAALPWSYEDWRDSPAAEQTERLSALLASDARVRFDLAQAPLMRVALRRVADQSYQFVWSTHHLYIDGWSWPIVFGDLSRAYAAHEAGGTPWRDQALPFKRYVQWLAVEAPDSQDFWTAQLAGLSAPTPFMLSAPAVASMAPDSMTRDSMTSDSITSDSNTRDSTESFAEVLTSLPVATTDALQNFARGSLVTLSAVFNAAWALSLAHYSGANSVVFGAAFSGRPADIAGIEVMVGPCVNNLPVRVEVEPAAELKPWLTSIQQRQFDIGQHQYAQLEQIQQWAGIAWRHRLFDSLVVFQNYQIDDNARRVGGNVRSTLISAPETTNYPLTLAVSVEQQMRIRLIFKSVALARADVEQFAQDLSSVLSAMAASETAPGTASGARTVGDILAALPARSRRKADEFAAARAIVRRSVFAAPASGAERAIAELWQQLFGVDAVSLDDNFFDLGGHSVLLVQAHARLKVSMRTDLPIVALLQYPTVRSLAHYLGGGADADRQKAASNIMDRAQKQREAQMRHRKIAGKHQ